METEPTKRSHSAHRKRRERAHQLQLEKFKSDDDSAEDANGPNGVGKDKGRSRPRKKRTGAGTYEEDIIDGFAIVSFKTANDLEVRVVKITSIKVSYLPSVMYCGTCRNVPHCLIMFSQLRFVT